MLTAENEKAIRWIADQIETKPELYEQGRWGEVATGEWWDLLSELDGTQARQLYAEECGTAQCVAGWAVQYVMVERGLGDLALRELVDTLGLGADPGWSVTSVKRVAQIAQEALGADPEQASTLFKGWWAVGADRMAVVLRQAADEGNWREALGRLSTGHVAEWGGGGER